MTDGQPAVAFGSSPMKTHAANIASPAKLDIHNVLLLEDDVELAAILKALLDARGFIVSTVTNGVDGLREVMAMDFDAIICDMMMPKMPGDMFYLAVSRAKPHLCERFIFVTGHSDNPKIDHFVKSVGGVVLHKPISTDELVATMREVMNRAAVASAE